MTKSPKNYDIDKKMLSTTGGGHKRAKTNEFRSFIIGGGQPSITQDKENSPKLKKTTRYKGNADRKSSSRPRDGRGKFEDTEKSMFST
jgi:hypothetical protein